MKFGVAFLIAATLAACVPEQAPVATADTSQVSLDWPGQYQGTLPCADCSGIKTTLTLREDGAYTLSKTYIDKGKPFVAQGRFVWDAAGSRITLDGAGHNRLYRVEEGRLRHLDLAGQPITGDLAQAYVLNKLK